MVSFQIRGIKMYGLSYFWNFNNHWDNGYIWMGDFVKVEQFQEVSLRGKHFPM